MSNKQSSRQSELERKAVEGLLQLRVKEIQAKHYEELVATPPIVPVMPGCETRTTAQYIAECAKGNVYKRSFESNQVDRTLAGMIQANELWRMHNINQSMWEFIGCQLWKRLDIVVPVNRLMDLWEEMVKSVKRHLIRCLHGNLDSQQTEENFREHFPDWPYYRFIREYHQAYEKDYRRTNPLGSASTPMKVNQGRLANGPQLSATPARTQESSKCFQVMQTIKIKTPPQSAPQGILKKILGDNLVDTKPVPVLGSFANQIKDKDIGKPIQQPSLVANFATMKGLPTLQKARPKLTIEDYRDACKKGDTLNNTPLAELDKMIADLVKVREDIWKVPTGQYSNKASWEDLAFKLMKKKGVVLSVSWLRRRWIGIKSRIRKISNHCLLHQMSPKRSEEYLDKFFPNEHFGFIRAMCTGPLKIKEERSKDEDQKENRDTTKKDEKEDEKTSGKTQPSADEKKSEPSSSNPNPRKRSYSAENGFYSEYIGRELKRRFEMNEDDVHNGKPDKKELIKNSFDYLLVALNGSSATSMAELFKDISEDLQRDAQRAARRSGATGK